MKLWEFNRTYVVISLKSGELVKGFVEDYCDASDNAEEMYSLLVDVNCTLYEYFEDEIVSVLVAQRIEQSGRFYRLNIKSIRTIEKLVERKINE